MHVTEMHVLLRTLLPSKPLLRMCPPPSTSPPLICRPREVQASYWAQFRRLSSWARRRTEQCHRRHPPTHGAHLSLWRRSSRPPSSTCLQTLWRRPRGWTSSFWASTVASLQLWQEWVRDCPPLQVAHAESCRPSACTNPHYC